MKSSTSKTKVKTVEPSLMKSNDFTNVSINKAKNGYTVNVHGSRNNTYYNETYIAKTKSEASNLATKKLK